jgi:hypothetical protein
LTRGIDAGAIVRTVAWPMNETPHGSN